MVKVWDIRTFQCVQTIADETTYRPENRLTGLYFNPNINSLVLTSKKINIWPFKAAEEMPTSHESTVTCAIFNKNFSCIISGDEESNVHIWDINEGKLLFKFTEAHNGNRITAMALDYSGRRLVTGAHDGSIKMWNFNNGQCLREFNYDHEPKEVSKLAFVGSDSSSKVQQIISVGWDKLVYIWPDENEPIVSWSKCLPASSGTSSKGPTGHSDDILSLTYCQREKLIVTGGQLGQVIAWHMETGFPRAYLHEIDPSLLSASEDEPKAVEDLIYSGLICMLISVSADNCIRFWDMRDITFRHKSVLENNGELITCACLGPAEDVLVVGDEVGNVRIIGIAAVSKISVLKHFNAHRAGITNLQLFTTEETNVTLLLTTGVSRNVKLFAKNCNFLGYLGQGKNWDIRGQGVPPRNPKYSQVFYRGGMSKGAGRENRESEENKKKEQRRHKEVGGSKGEGTGLDVFRGINIERYGPEPIYESLGENYKSRTGKEIILNVAGVKKL